MKPPIELDTELLCNEEDYLETLLARYCLHPAGDGHLAQPGDGRAGHLRGATGGLHPSDGDLDALHDYGEALNAFGSQSNRNGSTSIGLGGPGDPGPTGHGGPTGAPGAPGTHLDGEGRLAKSQPKIPSAEQLLQRLGELKTALWSAADKFQRAAGDNVREFVHCLRARDQHSEERSDSDLAESLHKCEGIISSVQRISDKTCDLMLLQQLEALLSVNHQAVLLIYNWDDTLRTTRGLLRSYKHFRDDPATSHTALWATSDSDEFNIRKAHELRDILRRLKLSKGFCNVGGSNLNSIAQTLEELLIEYASILDDVSADVVRHYLAPPGRCHDPASGDAAVHPEEAFRIFVQLHSDVFEPAEALGILLHCLRSGLVKALSVEFSSIWEEHDQTFASLGDMTPRGDHLGDIITAISTTLTEFLGLFRATVEQRREALGALFSTMESRDLLSQPLEHQQRLILEVFERALQNFETFALAMQKLPRAAFMSTAAAVLASLQCSLRDIWQAVGLDDNATATLSRMSIVPAGILERCVSFLDEHLATHCWTVPTETQPRTLSDYLELFDDLVSYVSKLKVGTNGFLTESTEVDAHSAFAWLYNRLLIWRLKDALCSLMAGCYKVVDDHFRQCTSRELPKELDTEDELACHRVLSSLAGNTRRLVEGVDRMLHSAQPSAASEDILAASVTFAFTDPDRLSSLEALPATAKRCLSEVGEHGSSASAILADEHRVLETAASYTCELVATRASARMRPYYTKAFVGRTMADDDKVEASRTILLVGEYFTALLPRLSEEDLLRLNILGTTFTLFVDGELEQLASARPAEPALRKCYRADIEHLMFICKYCGAEVIDSLEMLVDGC